MLFGSNDLTLSIAKLKIFQPTTGLEPATTRLEVWCAIHCATRAYK